jgi:FkbM family methyltransferase
MSSYISNQFTNNIPKNEVSIIFEVGARDGLDSISLSNFYDKSTVYAFECNPFSIETCIENLQNRTNIVFNPYGLGDEITKKSFFPYIANNKGASSFFKRVDFSETQTEVKEVQLDTIYNFCSNNTIDHIDILCMDTQGFELNILKGCKEFIKKVRYVILEEPRKEPNRNYLPEGHSKYVEAPSAYEIQDFFKQNNFTEVSRVYENELEDNVMYKNLSYTG